MPGQNAEIPALPWYLHLLGHVFHDQFFGSNDFELKGFSHWLAVSHWSLIVSKIVSVVGSCQRPTAHDQRLLLRCRLHLLGSLNHFIDRALHIEGLLGDVVVLASHD